MKFSSEHKGKCEGLFNICILVNKPFGSIFQMQITYSNSPILFEHYFSLAQLEKKNSVRRVQTLMCLYSGAQRGVTCLSQLELPLLPIIFISPELAFS